MLSNIEFVRQSLELHLFFARIMKEHSFFLQTSFTQRDSNLMLQADAFRKEFDKLLAETISLSSGVVSHEVLMSGEVVTPFTLNAEIVSAYLTGVDIPTGLTQAEQGLMGSHTMMCNPMLEQRVCMINNRAIELVTALIQFKTMLLSEVLSCKLYTVNYPLLIDHILREAKLYLNMIKRLQKREEINLAKEAYEQEIFWNNIMGEHAKFIRGLLDPTEEQLIEAANDFGNEFDELTRQSKEAMEKAMPISTITKENMEATVEIRDFKWQGTQGLLDCKIRSIIIPLLADHTLREANHYLRLLKIFKRACK